MKLYTAKIRIGGSRDHEVVKHNLTGAEMKLLEAIHEGPQGHPVVVDIKHTGNVTRSDAKERARLADIYSKGELTENRGEKMISALFGVAGVPLPQEYVATEKTVVEAFEVEDEIDEVITPVEEPVKAEPKRSKKAEADVGAVIG
jgi:hypothetical protein